MITQRDNLSVQAVWTKGRVPNGFWHERRNRLAYMNWLGRRLGFKNPDDWYGVSRMNFRENYGGGLLATIYGDSPLAAVRDYMRRYKWLPWLFRSTPQGFWQDVENRRSYMAWLEKELCFRRNEDWYRISKQDFVDNAGAGLLNRYYNDSVIAAVREHKPRWHLQEWQFIKVPQGFWKVPSHRARYMNWLAEQLDIRTPESWYDVSPHDVKQNCGETVLGFYGGSVYRMLVENLPDMDWKPWLFRSVENGYWNCAKNRRAYLCWLGEMLGFRRPADWYGLTPDQIRRHGGSSVFTMYYRNSRPRVLRERYPNYPWNGHRLNGRLTA